MEQELSNCPSADGTFLSSTFPNTHSLWATLRPDCWRENIRKYAGELQLKYKVSLIIEKQ